MLNTCHLLPTSVRVFCGHQDWVEGVLVCKAGDNAFDQAFFTHSADGHVCCWELDAEQNCNVFKLVVSGRLCHPADRQQSAVALSLSRAAADLCHRGSVHKMIIIRQRLSTAPCRRMLRWSPAACSACCTCQTASGWCVAVRMAPYGCTRWTVACHQLLLHLHHRRRLQGQLCGTLGAACCQLCGQVRLGWGACPMVLHAMQCQHLWGPQAPTRSPIVFPFTCHAVHVDVWLIDQLFMMHVSL